jgi:hypothetical protein
MTKQFLLFLVLFLPFIAFAQGINITVTGTVTNSTTGAPVANQVVNIFTDSTCGSYSGTAITGTNGTYSVTFLTANTPQCGLYGYTSGCNGALVYQQSWFGNSQTTATMNFQVACGGTSSGCQAAFTTSISAMGTVICTNQSTASNPNTPFTSSWTINGGASGTLTNPGFVLSPGSYVICLTIADNTGCTSTYCDSVVVGGSGGSSCQASFTYQVSGNGVSFAGQALNISTPVTYFWDFGNNINSSQQNPYVVFTSGTYNVCLTTLDSSVGCYSTNCQNITVGTVTPPSTISGYVFLDSTMQSSGGAINLSRVWLIQYDSVAGTLTAIDSQSVSISSPNGMFAGYYSFTGVAQGDYLVKCALLSGPDYATNLPTYYGGSLYWASAFYAQPSNNNYNFTLITGTNPGGPGFIGGLVSQGANKMSGAAIPNAQVMLLDINDNPIAYTYSDALGAFSFSNLAYGTYKIYTEVLNKTTTPVLVTISPNHASENGVSVEINSTYVAGSVSAIENNAYFQSVKVYPNPATDNASLNLNLKKAANVEVSLQNVMGQTIFTQAANMSAGEQAMTISLQNLPKGIYILKVMANGAAQEMKVVKE